MGTPQFAVPILEALITATSVVVVVTQPDKPIGRGKRVEPSPVKVLALKKRIPVLEPKRLRKEVDILETLRIYDADLFVVAAYGQILPADVLEIPKHGCINVHASLLPRWRGASPIQNAILAGDRNTGVTIMQMDAGMDTGPILAQHELRITADDTGMILSQKLSILGQELLLGVLPDYLAGELTPIPQNDELATYTALIKKEDGLLDFNQTAIELDRKVRAFNPWPGTFMPWKNSQLKILQVEILQGVKLHPGEKEIREKYPVIGTKEAVLRLLYVQVPGKNIVSGKDFLNGARDWLTA